jgi:hypothetical protein
VCVRERARERESERARIHTHSASTCSTVAPFALTATNALAPSAISTTIDCLCVRSSLNSSCVFRRFASVELTTRFMPEWISRIAS